MQLMDNQADISCSSKKYFKFMQLCKQIILPSKTRRERHPMVWILGVFKILVDETGNIQLKRKWFKQVHLNSSFFVPFGCFIQYFAVLSSKLFLSKVCVSCRLLTRTYRQSIAIFWEMDKVSDSYPFHQSDNFFLQKPSLSVATAPCFLLRIKQITAGFHDNKHSSTPFISELHWGLHPSTSS